MKKFYYAQSNDAYVEISDAEYAELMNLLDYNVYITEKYDDPVFELAENDPVFAANEKRIQEILRMTDEQFDLVILY